MNYKEDKMSLFFANNKDQALLTMVIQKASIIAKKQGKYTGRTHLQKILYFLKVLDIPMNYRFDIYHYGPFCQEILNDVDLLIADEVIKDESSFRTKFSNYIPDKNSSIMIEQFPELEKYRVKVKKVATALVPLKPEMLELLSTLDYLYHWAKASGINGPFKETVIRNFKELKGKKFKNRDIEATYDILVNTGFIEK